ncbi:response regulator [Phosphitispora fastidiosa]|uniref:response regulator n=1 Tax=Phosphitispora fastidiosa TaxID=2837202 RepID=UPI001E34B1C1|nr:two-component SAPR family response regulator [Phosphitispora fastidiosa]
MVTAILVDDERPALRGLEFFLRPYPEISIVGMYTNPLIALDEIGRLRPEAVFLDINMPQLKGVDLASKILDVSPGTDIVFVTAFDQYAVEAFEIHALDYILKPINQERLRKTVERLVQKKPLLKEKSARKLQIKCLGWFQVTWEGQEPIKWRTEKTKELFAFLLYNQGRDVSKDELLDRLWTEIDPEKAIRQLYNGIYYIRKALEEYDVDRSLICIDSNYNLKLGPVDFDVKNFCDLTNSTESDTLETLEVMESLYAGDYLEGEDYQWTDSERESLARLYQQCLIKLSQHYVKKKNFEKAESILIKAYLKNPYEEIITELLLRLYMETGEKSKAVIHFNSYSKLLQEDLDIEPNAKLYRIYQSIK